MAFCSQKPAAVSAAFGCCSLFACNIGFPLSVGRPEVRPTDLRMAVFPTVTFPADLLRGEKALNCWIWYITSWYIAKYTLNNLSTKACCPTNGCEKKNEVGVICRCFFFSSAVVCCWRSVEVAYSYIPILYYLYSTIQQNIKAFPAVFS